MIKTISKHIEDDGKPRIITATIGVHGQNPYFTSTYELTTESGKTVISGGYSPKMIRRYFPELKDILALHLSDVDGIPMYCLENGFYYCENPEEYNDMVIAKHFRIGIESVPVLRFMTKNQLAEWIEGEKPRWKVEADACRLKYEV